MSTQKLKLGLLLDSFEVPAWLFHSLEQIANSDYAEFAVILIIDGNQRDSSSNWFNKFWRNKRKLAYEIFNTIDEKVFLRGPNAFETKNLQKMLAGVPVVTVKPIIDGNSEVFKSEDVKESVILTWIF